MTARAEAVRKLLRLGGLTSPQLEQVMGGCPLEVQRAVDHLRRIGHVSYWRAGRDRQPVYQLTDAGKAA